jgi:hypothetical protein
MYRSFIRKQDVQHSGRRKTRQDATENSHASVTRSTGRKKLPNKKPITKEIDEKKDSFAFRMRNGEQEIEIKGTHDEVTKTIANLPSLIGNITVAFDALKPKTVATLTVKTEAQPKSDVEEHVQSFPKIASPKNSEEAIFRILGTDWGKWRPRTVEELKEAMKANGLRYSDRVLSDTLDELAKKGMVHRWNTNTGFVYILGEEKSVSVGEQA